MIVPYSLLLDKSIDSKPPYCCNDDGILPCNILPAKFNTFNWEAGEISDIVPNISVMVMMAVVSVWGGGTCKTITRYC